VSFEDMADHISRAATLVDHADEVNRDFAAMRREVAA
jgi:hypothetical protein